MEPDKAVAASDAIVRHKASARSGDFNPRLRISSLLSAFILPDDVNEYRIAVNSASKRSLSGSLHDLSSSQPFVLNHNSDRKFICVLPIAGASPTFIPLTGAPNSRSLSTTPPPTPILSTSISLGCMLVGKASYSAITRPTVCIKSKPCQAVISVTTLPYRLHNAVLSDPNLATSKPQIGFLSGVTSTSRRIALSTK